MLVFLGIHLYLVTQAFYMYIVTELQYWFGIVVTYYECSTHPFANSYCS